MSFAKILAAVGEVTTTPKNAKLGPMTDPAGNAITLTENPST